jgi:hypothetical protein
MYLGSIGWCTDSAHRTPEKVYRFSMDNSLAGPVVDGDVHTRAGGRYSTAVSRELFSVLEAPLWRASVSSDLGHQISDRAR